MYGDRRRYNEDTFDATHLVHFGYPSLTPPHRQHEVGERTVDAPPRQPRGIGGNTPVNINTRPRRRSFTRSCVDVLGVLVGNVPGLDTQGHGLDTQGSGLDRQGQGFDIQEQGQARTTQGQGLGSNTRATLAALDLDTSEKSGVDCEEEEDVELVDSSDDDDDDGVLDVWRDAGDDSDSGPDETSPVKSSHIPVKSPVKSSHIPVKSSDIFSPSKVDNFYDFEVDDSSDEDEKNGSDDSEASGGSEESEGSVKVKVLEEEMGDNDHHGGNVCSDDGGDYSSDGGCSSDDDDDFALHQVTFTNTQRNALISYTLAVTLPPPPLPIYAPAYPHARLPICSALNPSYPRTSPQRPL